MIETAAPGQRVILLGISQGGAACVTYAVRHPERVSHMVLYGVYARGHESRGDSEQAREYRAIVELVRAGWGRDNPAFRQVFTSRFVPGGSAEQIAWFNDLCRKTTSPAIAAELMTVRSQVDVVGLLPQVRVPTLVIHAREDAIAPLAAGRSVAAGIPGAQFVELDSRNHILLEGEPAWERFQEAVLDFTGVAAAAPHEDAAFAALSPRERDVLALVTEGLGNAEIGERLDISEKTVRNHITERVRQAGRVDARAGHRLRAGPRVPARGGLRGWRHSLSRLAPSIRPRRADWRSRRWAWPGRSWARWPRRTAP